MKNGKRFHNMDLTEFEWSEFDYPILNFKKVPMPQELIQFDTSKQNKTDGTCHFYIDDYKFERVIGTRPDQYLNYLSKFESVIMPDFSMYDNVPRWVALYNKGLNHIVSKYWMDHNIPVICNPQWMTGLHFDMLFDGFENVDIFATSSVGCIRRNRSREIFIQGFNAFIERFEPSQCIFYGTIPDGLNLNDIEIKRFKDRIEQYNGGK